MNVETIIERETEKKLRQPIIVWQQVFSFIFNSCHKMNPSYQQFETKIKKSLKNKKRIQWHRQDDDDDIEKDTDDVNKQDTDKGIRITVVMG